MIKLKTITLDDGRTVAVPSLTIVLGPNNSGKSSFLYDISLAIRGYVDDLQILSKVDIALASHGPPTEQQCSELGIESTDSKNVYRGFTHRLQKSDVGAYADHKSGPETVHGLGVFLHSFLGTDTRLYLAAARRTAEPSLLKLLYNSNKAIMSSVGACLRQCAVDLELVLDIYQLSTIRLRVAKPPTRLPEDILAARRFVDELTALDHMGDGVKAIAGIAMALHAVRRPVVLIDEPELFLHPPQAYEFGRYIASNFRDSQLILATHSAEFLRGLLSVARDTLVVRLDGPNRKPNIIDENLVRSLSEDPHLAASRAVEALSSASCIIVESEADATFYRRVADRLSHRLDGDYIYAHGKQNIPRIISPLRQMGVSAIAIADFDVLRDTRELRKLLVAAGCGDESMEQVVTDQRIVAAEVEAASAAAQLDEIRDQLQAVLEEFTTLFEKPEEGLSLIQDRLQAIADSGEKWRHLKRGGRDALNASGQKAFDRIRATCSALGIFIVPTGELESLAKDIGVDYTRNKQRWLNQALETLRETEVDLKRYPWKFVAEVVSAIPTFSVSAPSAGGGVLEPPDDPLDENLTTSSHGAFSEDVKTPGNFWKRLFGRFGE